MTWALQEDGAEASLPSVTATDLNPAGLDEVHLSKQDVEAASPGLSDFQRALIADGRLTFADYDQAYRAYVACLERAGGKLESPLTLTTRNTYTVRIGLRRREVLV